MQIVDRGTLGRRKQARVIIIVDVKPVDGVVVPVQLRNIRHPLLPMGWKPPTPSPKSFQPSVPVCVDIGAKREVVAKRGRGHALQAVGIDQDKVGGGAGPAGRAQEACVRRCHPEIDLHGMLATRADLSPIAAGQVEYPDIGDYRWLRRFASPVSTSPLPGR